MIIHVRVFIHLREDLARDEHFAIFGRVDKGINEVRIIECQAAAEDACPRPPRTEDGGLIEYIKTVSRQDDTFIILAHNPGDEYRTLDHNALHAFGDKYKVEASTASMYIFNHYGSDLQKTFPELYFS